MEHLIDIIRATAWPLSIMVCVLSLRPVILGLSIHFTRH